MDNLIFVFGSNLAGRHGKGAALHARLEWGAGYGVGEGLTGRSYALPTKDEKLRVRTLEQIEKSIHLFTEVAAKNQHLLFLTTPIGCGLAGYKQKDIRAIFMKYPITNNVVFTREWFQPYNEVKIFG